ncbi:MAG: hypothetical protein KA116_12120 [Proteobacteria bacterium]|nr:hypothetical protein [Pseudomonadota bacterium]
MRLISLGIILLFFTHFSHAACEIFSKENRAALEQQCPGADLEVAKSLTKAEEKIEKMCEGLNISKGLESKEIAQKISTEEIVGLPEEAKAPVDVSKLNVSKLQLSIVFTSICKSHSKVAYENISLVQTNISSVLAKCQTALNTSLARDLIAYEALSGICSLSP